MTQNVQNAFRLVVEKAKKLSNLGFRESVSALRFNIVTSGEGTTFTLSGPTEEQTDAFILTFRFFIQKNEPSSFAWLAEYALTDPEVSKEWKQYFANLQTDFLRCIMKQGLTMIANDLNFLCALMSLGQ